MADLIDRQAAIDFIDAGHLCNPNEPRWSDNEIVNFLKSRPSAQPERKTGRWVFDRLETTSGCFYGVRRCSVCGMIGGGTRYCPYCGARMDNDGE